LQFVSAVLQFVSTECYNRFRQSISDWLMSFCRVCFSWYRFTRNRRDTAYKFNRIKITGALKVHPKITLVNRRKYWDIGGCDEDFVRVYGFGDGTCTLKLSNLDRQTALVVSVLISVFRHNCPRFTTNDYAPPPCSALLV
jgi:hypothetical protein